MPESVDRTPLAEDRAAGATALLVIDMLSTWDFPDGEQMLAAAERIAPRIADLRGRCRSAGVPVIYANDNRGRWRSDFREVVAMAVERGGGGARVAELLKPAPDDYFILKPKHSGFHATPLDLLLRHLQARRLVVTGVSGDQCVLYTVADARMNDYEVVVPRDAVASLSAERDRRLLDYLAEVSNVPTPAADEVELPAAR
jgi:nicotinamidase-related amidase